MEPIAAFLWTIVVLAVYFLPGIVAVERKHPQATAIFALNLLLGWTILGWIAALVWSLTAVRRDPSD